MPGLYNNNDEILSESEYQRRLANNREALAKDLEAAKLAHGSVTNAPQQYVPATSIIEELQAENARLCDIISNNTKKIHFLKRNPAVQEYFNLP